MSKSYRLVNLSNNFLIRSVCKYCGSFALFYSSFFPAQYYKDPNSYIKKFDWIRKNDKITNNDYVGDDPSQFNRISSLSYSLPYRKYNPKIHRVKGLSKITDQLECLFCECGKTYWIFCSKSIINRPEILNRKSRIYFPAKFNE
jgi:hypothetical protein